MPRQSQSGGDFSTNIQAENVTLTGLTYADVKNIAIDVFNQNFLTLSEQADAVARERAEIITEKYLSELRVQNPEGIKSAQDPDFQYALFTVQKEYARIGDDELGDLLIDLLVDRTKHPTRSIIQIVLNESLSIAPKLTTDQLSALTIIFIIKHTINRGVNNLIKFGEHLDKHIQPFAGALSKNSSCYQHLAYAGCGSISVAGSGIGDLFRENYSGIFSKGFTINDLEKKQITIPYNSSFFITCQQDSDKIQINAMTEEVVTQRANELKIDEKETKKLIDLYKASLMNKEEVKNYLISLRPYMAAVFETWENSYMKNMNLTSVGIAIGHANAKRQIGEFTDLSIWIN